MFCTVEAEDKVNGLRMSGRNARLIHKFSTYYSITEKGKSISQLNALSVSSCLLAQYS